MSVRQSPRGPKPAYAQADREIEVRRGQRRVLERAYPLAQRLANVLELEADPELVRAAKRLRRAIGQELGLLGLGVIREERAAANENIAVAQGEENSVALQTIHEDADR